MESLWWIATWTGSITMLIRRAAGHRQNKLRNSANSSLVDLTAHHVGMRFLLLSSTKCFRPLFTMQVMRLNSYTKRSWPILKARRACRRPTQIRLKNSTLSSLIILHPLLPILGASVLLARKLNDGNQIQRPTLRGGATQVR
ncbi:hypothetical protein BKA83DRAFT_1977904 [Pisolithus microcarpus]|nr:hypothetical protein BKA83DRAFT_1977904 [Pisolithus microcarpus]